MFIDCSRESIHKSILPHELNFTWSDMKPLSSKILLAVLEGLPQINDPNYMHLDVIQTKLPERMQLMSRGNISTRLVFQKDRINNEWTLIDVS
jgi:hypothetical protein